jgi:hypothetical protein
MVRGGGSEHPIVILFILFFIVVDAEKILGKSNAF